jgi:hypothetical protein
MSAVLVTRDAPDAWVDTPLFETLVAPLRNAEQPARFVF